MDVRELASLLTEPPVPVWVGGHTAAGKTTLLRQLCRELACVVVATKDRDIWRAAEPYKVPYNIVRERLPDALRELQRRVAGETTGRWTYDAAQLAAREAETYEEFLAKLRSLAQSPDRALREGARSALDKVETARVIDEHGAELTPGKIFFLSGDVEFGAVLAAVDAAQRGKGVHVVIDDVPSRVFPLILAEVQRARRAAPVILTVPSASFDPAVVGVFPVAVWVGGVECDSSTALRWRIPRDALHFRRGVAWARVHGRWHKIKFDPLPAPATEPAVRLPRLPAPATTQLKTARLPEREPEKCDQCLKLRELEERLAGLESLLADIVRDLPKLVQNRVEEFLEVQEVLPAEVGEPEKPAKPEEPEAPLSDEEFLVRRAGVKPEELSEHMKKLEAARRFRRRWLERERRRLQRLEERERRRLQQRGQ